MMAVFAAAAGLAAGWVIGYGLGARSKRRRVHGADRKLYG